MRILFCFLLLLAFNGAAQTTYSDFKLVEQEIIYQKVFPADSITVAKLEAYYKTLPYVANLSTTGEGLQFDLNDLTVDYKKFQFTKATTPQIMQTGKYSGKVSVGVRDGRYRITVQSIQLTGNIEYKMITEKDNLTRYATKNSATILSPDWCKPNMLGLLNQAFTDKLEFKKTGDDW
jgi:hypothetical protein